MIEEQSGVKNPNHEKSSPNTILLHELSQAGMEVGLVRGSSREREVGVGVGGRGGGRSVGWVGVVVGVGAGWGS